MADLLNVTDQSKNYSEYVALAWFRDLLGLFHEYGWGFAFWNFQGPFGIIDHHRKGTHIERIHGYQVDRELLDLIFASRVD